MEVNNYRFLQKRLNMPKTKMLMGYVLLGICVTNFLFESILIMVKKYLDFNELISLTYLLSIILCIYLKKKYTYIILIILLTVPLIYFLSNPLVSSNSPFDFTYQISGYIRDNSESDFGNKFSNLIYGFPKIIWLTSIIYVSLPKVRNVYFRKN